MYVLESQLHAKRNEHADIYSATWDKIKRVARKTEG